MKQNKLFKLWLLAVVMLAGSMGVSGETITITGADMSGTDGAQAITKSGIDFNGFMKQYQTTKIWFTSGTGYIYNSTSLGSINKITLSYNTGGSAASIQRFNVGASTMSSYMSTGGSTVTTSTGGTTYEYTGGSGFGFFNISVSSKNLQLVSIVIDYTPGSTNTTAAPTFTPPAGTYTAAQSVTLSSTTTDAKIYYTIDGTEPTSGSTLYTGAINVAATTTIKAIAYDASNANPSAVVTAQYIINLTPTLLVVPSVVPAMSAYTGAAADTEIIAVSGTNLTSDINAQISGDNASQFSVSPATLTQSGGNFTITYSPSATAATHTATLTLSSTDAVDVVLSLNGQTKLALNEGTANETFATQTELTATYANGSFSSETAGVTVNYVHARNEGFDTADDYSISGKGIMLRRADEPSSVEFVIPTGVGSFLFDYRKAFTGGSERKLAVVVDGVESFVTAGFGTLASTNETTVYAFNETINKTGTVSVKITYPAGTPTGNRQVTIDNVSWTSYPTTGLQNIKSDALAWTSGGKVMLNASAGEVIEIFNVAGQKVVSRPAVDGLNSVDVSAKGVVIVKVNNRISKVIL